MANIAPTSYNVSLQHKKKEPKWTMGERLSSKSDSRYQTPSPDKYNLPSKMIEHPGKTIGMKLKDTSLEKKLNDPGPGAYNGEKLKKNNLQYSLAGRLRDSIGLNVPGPGTYNGSAESLNGVKTMKFGTGQRSDLGMNLKKKSPGPGEHEPDYMKVSQKAPKWGFGSETRSTGSKYNLQVPGPGNYQIKSLVGSEGKKITLHQKLKFSPEMKEHGSKPGPGAYDGNFKKVVKNDPAFKVGTSERGHG